MGNTFFPGNRIVDRLKRRLGFPVVSIYTPDETITDLIEQTLEKIQPYLRETTFIQGSGDSTDLTDYNIMAVLRVFPGMISRRRLVHQDIDPFAVVNVARVAKDPNYLTQVLARNIQRSEIQSAVVKDWEFKDNKLMVSGFSGPYTIEAISRTDVESMSNTYQQWCFDYALALLKITEGEIRSKVRVPSAPVEMNGEALKNEGLEERRILEDRLGGDISLFFATR